MLSTVILFEVGLFARWVPAVMSRIAISRELSVCKRALAHNHELYLKENFVATTLRGKQTTSSSGSLNPETLLNPQAIGSISG